MNDYISLLDLGFYFLQNFLSHTGNKLPAQVVAAIQAALDAIAAHRADEVTKANLESNRG